MEKNLSIALVGLGFGADFIPIYLNHPLVRKLTIFDTNIQVLEEVGNRFELANKARSFEEILDDKSIDAVHLVTPIPLHAKQTIDVFQSGKHCACTVPMATSIKDLLEILKAQRKSNKVYMGMETAVYTRHFIYAQEMLKNDKIGRIQLLRGAHYQDMEKWPSYWI